MATLEAENAKLKNHVADLANEVSGTSEEIWHLNTESKEGHNRIRNYIGNLGDVIKKARLFDNDIKTDDHISAPQVVAILVEFNRHMELTLAKMRKLLAVVLFEPFQLLVPLPSRTLVLAPRPMAEVSLTPEVHRTPAALQGGKEMNPASGRKETLASAHRSVEKPPNADPSRGRRRISQPRKRALIKTGSESEEDVSELEEEGSFEELDSEEEATPPSG